SAEELVILLHENADSARRSQLQQHADGCSWCRTELHLLQVFEAGEIAPDEDAAVEGITRKLRARSAEIFQQPGVPVTVRRSWWRDLLSAGWVRPVGL